MAGFKIEKQTAGSIAIDDLGITLTGAIGVIVDLTDLAPENLSRSADLLASITADEILVVDPRDDGDTTILTKAESTNAVNRSNDTHFGISGGRFGAVDDPTVTPGADFIIQYNSGGDAAEYINPDEFMSNQSGSIGVIVGGMGSNGSDTTFVFDATAFPLIAGQDETNYDAGTNNGTFAGTATAGAYVIGDVITLSDGSTVTVDAVSTGDITDFTVTTSSGANTTAGVTLTQTSVLPANGQTGFTLTPEQNNISQGTLQWDVDDSYLRNTGDSLDSGTLTISSGASLSLPTGSSISIAGDTTAATIETPGGGFANDNDIINKFYVDSVATGLDFKESVHMCTVADLDAAYANGTLGLGATLTGNNNGVLPPSITDDHAHYVIGTRILVKSQTDQIQNGIYEITDTGTGEEVTKVVTLADSGDNLDGKYFEFNASNGAYFVWFNTSGGSATVPGGTGTAIEVAINTNALDSAVTGATVSAINGSSAAVVAYVDENNTFFIVDDVIGSQTDAVDVDSGFTITTEVDGIAVGTKFVLTRTTDADNSPSNEVSGGMFTFVEDGATCAATGWVLTEPVGAAVLGTDDLIFTQFSGQGTFTAGVGIDITGSIISMDIDNMSAATIASADEIAFNDVTDGISKNTTVSNFISDLDIVQATSNGFVVRTADDTYAARSITVSGAGPLDGLAVTNGSGVAGDPVVGLDIQNLSLRAAVDATNDRVAVWDSTANANVYYTVNDIAGAASASNSFETWARSGNGAGGSLVATSATDTVTLSGGIGIDLDTTPVSDLIQFTFSDSGMADTAVVGADTVPFFDSGNAFEPEFRSWTNIISDLGLITGLSAATNEDLLGIDVTGTVIGLDILGLTDPGADMAATDEFAVHDKSEGTAGANRKMTGTNIAEGTATILGIATLTFDTFPAVTSPADDQTLLAYTDSVRSKTLSVESHTFQWADNKIKDNDWIKVGSAGDADTGWVMPLDATIVGVTAHTENTGGGNTYAIDLYIDAVDSGAIATLTGGANASDTDPTLNIDVAAGAKIRLRADQSVGAGDMQDTTVALLVKWRS